MAQPQPRTPQRVVKQEENESALRWIECKSLLAAIWQEVPAVPSLASRRAWGVAHGVNPSGVHEWFRRKKEVRVRKGTRNHPEDGYTLPLKKATEEQPSSSTSLDPVPPLDNPSSPSYLPMSSPPPRTPLDINNDLPDIVSSDALFTNNQTADPSFLGVSGPKSHPPSILPSEVDLAVKTEILDTIPASAPQVSVNGKSRKIILRVAPDAEEGSSKRPRKNPRGSKPVAKTAQSKKRRPKKAPKTEQVDQEENLGLQGHPALDMANSMMAFPQSLPPGFCIPPYFPYANPAMTFGTGMNGAHNLPPHSFGPMLYNPYTGAPLFNNAPAQFPNFNGQPSQPTYFNGNPGVGPFGQMDLPNPGPPIPGLSSNVMGNAPMDQNPFLGNFQGFQSNMPINEGVNFQNPPEPTMSMMDYLNEPLGAEWTYT